MTDAFAIETNGRSAGIAVRDGKGFLFYASDTLFWTLENRRFRSLHDVRTTVDRQLAGHAHRLSRKETRNTLLRRQQLSPELAAWGAE